MLTRRSLLIRGAACAAPLLTGVRAVAAEVKRVRITDVESFRVHIPGGDAREEMKVYSYGGQPCAHRCRRHRHILCPVSE